jgi:hypothetical protein
MPWVGVRLDLSPHDGDTGRVEMAAICGLPVAGRHIALDERAIGLRATWHLDRGFVNLSLRRDQSCVETFHLTPEEDVG